MKSLLAFLVFCMLSIHSLYAEEASISGNRQGDFVSGGVEMRHERTLEERLDAPVWPVIKPEFLPMPSRKSSLPYFVGGMIGHPRNRIAEGSFYLRRRFTLSSDVKRAVIAFLADDAGTLYLNGEKIVECDNWRRMKRVEVGTKLRNGVNVLAVEYTNRQSAGGVLIDLQINCENGEGIHLGSDAEFKCALSVEDGWLSEGFDDSGWGEVTWHEPPPALPWDYEFPYEEIFAPQRAVSLVPERESYAAGEKVCAVARFAGEIPPLPTAVRVTARLETGFVLPPVEVPVTTENVTSLPDGEWAFPVEYPLPKVLKEGGVTLGMEIFREHEGELSCSIQCVATSRTSSENITVEMRSTPAGPRLFIDGEMHFPAIACVPRNSGPDPMDVEFRLLFPMGEWWVDEDTYDFTAFDIAFEQASGLYPNAKYFVQIGCYPPAGWEKNHPEEMARTQDGRRSRHQPPETPHSFASKVALEDTKKAVAACIRYLEASPYAGKLVGYRIIGGHTAEWINWSHQDKWFFDYSKPAREAFAKFASERYPQLKSVEVPSEVRRKEKSMVTLDLLDPKVDLDIIAYNEFCSESIVDYLIALCRCAKEASGGRKLVGTYYGYCLNLPGGPFFQCGGHFALRKLLESKSIDFLMSPPSYSFRHNGETLLDMKPFGTVQANGVLSLIEDDPRTHSITPLSGNNYDQTISPRQTLNYLKRSFGIALCRQSGMLMYTFEGKFHSEFTFPEMRDLAAVISATGRFAWEKGVERHSEVAVVVSESSLAYLAAENRGVHTNDLLRQNYNSEGYVGRFPLGQMHLSGHLITGVASVISRCGAPVDFILAEELNKHLDDYKLYVFTDAFACDSAFREAIKRLQERQVTLLWLYAPGYYQGLSASTQNMTELTGFRFRMHRELPAEVYAGNGFFWGLKDDKLTPGFEVLAENDVKTLAHYTGYKDICGYAERQMGKALSIFSGAYVFPASYFRDLARRSGVHIFDEDCDPLEANEGFVALHVRFPGKKTITLKERHDVLDVFNRRMIARETNEFSFEAPLHSSWLFYVGDDADELLERLNSAER